MDGELIEKLLQTSGLSCEDLLLKLQQYKLKQSSKSQEKKQDDCVVCEENDCEQQCTTNNDNSVILETQSSTVDSSNGVNDISPDEHTTVADNPEKSETDEKDENSCDSSFIQKVETSKEIAKNPYFQDSDSCNAVVLEDAKEKEGSEEILTQSLEEKHEASDQNLKKVENCEEVVEEETFDKDEASCSKDSNEEIEDKPVEESIRENIVERLLRKTSARSYKEYEKCDKLLVQDSKDSCEELGVNKDSEKDSGANENAFKEDSKMFSEDSSNSTDIHNYSDLVNSLEDSASCASGLSKSTVDTSENVPIAQPEMAISTVEELPRSEEQLRDVLKMQLSSLRNMKKSSGYLPDLNRKSMFFHNLRKKRKSCDVKTIKPNIESENNEEEGKILEENCDKGIKEAETNDDSLVSLSDQTGFLILDVTGGIDRLTPEINDNDQEKIEERCFAVVSSSIEDVPSEINKDTSELPTENNIEDATKNYSPSKEIRDLLTSYRKKMSLNYFDANFSTLKGHDKFKKDQHQNKSNEDVSQAPETQSKVAHITVKKHISESFSEDPGVKKSVKNNEKSPFVSDSLEDFLKNESAQLKISYPIPKLGAEEGINESTKEISPFDSMVKVQKIEPVIEKETPQRERKLIKAKTLADMRRQFEKLNKEAKKREKKEIKSEIPSVASYRNSHIFYNNQKLWVTTKTGTGCAGVISSPNSEQFSPPTNKKLSLLSTLHQRPKRSVSYKPGPLSKKCKLQDAYSRDKWTTELKALPQIFLEVTPQFNKPIDPDVVHLVPVFDDCIITEERTNFALTALKTDNGPKLYTFPIRYKNNQTHLVVRKRVEPVSAATTKVAETDPEKIIASVLNDLISYVEIKEIEDTLIMEDDVVLEEPEPLPDLTPKSRGRGRRIKRNKVDLELLRLSCKVIDVATTATEDKPCSKAFCKMGCVCRSLLCESVFSDHCQMVECMFGCKCPPSETSSNSLHVHTVNHLEDKAKKNLAKVEREFTQTVIHTDNDTILVGSGKVRRCTKTPKKYTDYIGDVDDVFVKPSPDFESKKPRVKKCSVVLERLNLRNIKPLCLFHRMYECSRCVNRLPLVDNPYSFVHNIFNCACNKDVKVRKPNYEIVKYNPSESCARIRKVFSQYKERNKDPIYNAKLRKKNPNYFLQQVVKETEVISKPTFKQYESKQASKRKQSFVVREDEEVPIDPGKGTVLPSQDEDREIQVVSPNKEFQFVSPDNEFHPVFPDKEFALQRRRKKKVVVDTQFQKANNGIFDGEIKLSLKENQSLLPFVYNQKSLEYLRILPWKNLIQNYNTRKMSIWAKENGTTILCNAAGYLPPKNFVNIRRLKNKSEFINWIVTNVLPDHIPRHLMHVILAPRKSHYMISGYCLKKAEDISAARREARLETQPSTSFENLLTNVESHETNCGKTDDISLNSLLKNHSTFKFSRLYKSVLLKPKPKSVALETVRLKTATTSIKSVSGGAMEVNVVPLSKRSSHRETETIEIDCGSNSEDSRPTDLDEVTSRLSKKLSDNTNSSALLSERTLKCTHKDMHNHEKTLVLTIKELPKRRIYIDKDSPGGDFLVPLPRVHKFCRWRMIYLNSDFSYLNFTKSNYSIKYTDLLDVVKMASTVRSTITLRNQEIRQFYKTYTFGIFCVPDHQDRIFVGPYLKSESHNIETLRYLQGKLIDTETFNKIIGKKSNERSPVWLYETLPHNSIPDGLVIDITEDDEVPVEVSLEPSTRSLLCPPFVTPLSDEELKSKHSINRYIITNIPYLGYFGACQRDSKEIEVFWPNNTRGYRFPNVTLAKNLLIHYLSQIFCPIPQAFKINVIIMTHLDLKTNTPVKAKYLTEPGPFFCGEFGIYEKENVPEDLLQESNVPSLDSLLKTYKESLENDESIIKLFGLFLMSNEELRKFPEPQQIMQWARTEIYIQKKLSDNYDSEKSDLKSMISKKLQRIKLLRKGIRDDQRSSKESETIEIPDSDDEDNHHVPKVFVMQSPQKNNSFVLKQNVVPAQSVLKKNDKEKDTKQSPVKNVGMPVVVNKVI